MNIKIVKNWLHLFQKKESLTCQKYFGLKTILLIGAGKSATVLIQYLIKESEANRKVVEAQHFDATIHEGVEITAPKRNLYPGHHGHRPDDQSELYWSLRKSNIKLGHNKSPL
jgi:hypothetical protein